MTQVLHVDFLSMAPDAGPRGREELLAYAASLAEIECVIEIGAIEAVAGSDFDLAFYFLLPDFNALEPFGTDPRYVRFLQGMIAPKLASFGGVDVSLQDVWPTTGIYAVCMAAIAPEESYDWEVKELLSTWASGQETSVVGLAVGDRQRYRGLAIAFADQPPRAQRPVIERLDLTYVAGRLRRLG